MLTLQYEENCLMHNVKCYGNLTKKELLNILEIKNLNVTVIEQEELSENVIRHLLLCLDFNITTKGYKYVVDGIKLAYKDRYLLCPIKNLYIELEKKYNVSYEKIYRSIAGSIEIMNNRISKNILYSFFHVNHSVTPKEFFEAIIDYFMDEY